MAKRVLIVEDEVNLVELLTFRLQTNGYNVEVALDGEDGLKKIKMLKPDIVILDIMLPKMHGYDVCRRVKENSQTKKIPIIILTARVQASDMQQAKDCGADAFIGKPFDPVELLNEIERLLKK